MNKLSDITSEVSWRKPPTKFVKLIERLDIMGRPHLVKPDQLKDETLIEVNALLDHVMKLIPKQSVLDTLKSIDEVIVKNPTMSISAKEMRFFWHDTNKNECVALCLFLKNVVQL